MDVKSHCSQIKAALSKRYGPGWSVTHQRCNASILIGGPRLDDGYRYIPGDLGLELNQMLDREGTCPVGGLSICTVDTAEIEQFINRLLQ